MYRMTSALSLSNLLLFSLSLSLLCRSYRSLSNSPAVWFAQGKYCVLLLDLTALQPDLDEAFARARPGLLKAIREGRISSSVVEMDRLLWVSVEVLLKLPPRWERKRRPQPEDKSQAEEKEVTLVAVTGEECPVYGMLVSILYADPSGSFREYLSSLGTATTGGGPVAERKHTAAGASAPA